MDIEKGTGTNVEMAEIDAGNFISKLAGRRWEYCRNAHFFAREEAFRK